MELLGRLLFLIMAYVTVEPLGIDSNCPQPGSKMELRRTVQSVFNEKYPVSCTCAW